MTNYIKTLVRFFCSFFSVIITIGLGFELKKNRTQFGGKMLKVN